MDKPSFDFSLVVNVHAGTKYLRRSLLSLEEAARYAGGYGLRTEIVIVLDRSPVDTVDLAEAYDYGAFDGFQIVHVDNGSLGLSRNDGLLAAKGEIVGFCDEDDLISYNTVIDFYNLAKSSGPDTIVQAEYYFCFSEQNFIYRYYGSDKLSPLGFITGHPFTSHVCVHKSIASRLRYADVRLSPGYAYEDWHFNSQAIANGFRFAVAPNTIVFYRKRSSGLLRSMDSISTRQPPPSALYNPPTYLRVCAKAYQEFRASGQPVHLRDKLVEDFFSHPLHLELAKAANVIEPAIDLVAAQHGPAGANIDCGLRRGAAYFRACQLVGASTFTDVAVLPFMTKGGGEKYILNVLNGIAALEPESRFLILAGQKLDRHEWIEFLPERSTFIDLSSLDDDLHEEDIDVLTLRLIEVTAPKARIHLKTSRYAHSFFTRFGKLLAGNRFIYYRFSDPVAEFDGQSFVRGNCFDFLSDNAERLDRVLSDHHRIVAHDRVRLESAREKWTALYTRCDPLTGAEAVRERGPAFRKKLLWAARLDREKRPDLLLLIAEALQRRLPDVSIDVYGNAVLNIFENAAFELHPNLSYRGSFASFAGIDHQAYDALLYTSLYDGLPNIVLEAMSAALPVFAPDLGGIGEAVVHGETGYLLPGDVDDAKLVSLYVEAIARFYGSPHEYVTLRLNALKAIQEKHAPGAFLHNLSDVVDSLR